MGKTILVVEDDRELSELIALYLASAGYTVRRVENGLEAASACLKSLPDLIISDVHMPRMDGFEMIRILKSEPGMKDVPVIFLTMDDKRRAEGGDLGATEYLLKPFEPDSLLSAVARHLARRS